MASESENQFAITYAWPIAVTVLTIVMYEFIDLLSCGTARRVYEVRFAGETNYHGYKFQIFFFELIFFLWIFGFSFLHDGFKSYLYN